MQMTVKLVRIPPIGKIRTERMKITFEGHHALEEKACMFMQAIAVLEHDHRIFRAGECDFWLKPVDADNHPLVLLPDGQSIAEHKLIVDNPYHTAGFPAGI
jgi:hypothetical protein